MLAILGNLFMAGFGMLIAYFATVGPRAAVTSRSGRRARSVYRSNM